MVLAPSTNPETIMERLPATCAALRRATLAALDLAAEADTDGRHGIAAALRRKVSAPRIGDWVIVHHARRVEARVSAYGVRAVGARHTTTPRPTDTEAERVAESAMHIVTRAMRASS